MARQLSRGGKRKRGIVLLVVLSLLALFVLIGVTYAIVAGHYRRAALAGQRFKQWDDDPRDYLDRAFYQLVRDTSGRSSLRGHSLLADLYGNDGVVGRIDIRNDQNGSPRGISPLGGGPLGSGQLVQFSFADAPDFGMDSPLQPFGKILTPGGLGAGGDDYYNGRVLTFLTGRVAGYSVRVVDTFFSRGPDGYWGTDGDDDSDANSDVDNVGEAGWNGSDDLVYLVVEDDLGIGLSAELVADVNNGILPTFIINGRQFNGTGHGLRVRSGSPPDMAARDPVFNRHVALLPHFAGYNANIPTRYPVNAGGADESWDAVDYQNMFLAMIPPDLLNGANGKLIPSFHRPDLVNYWKNFADSNNVRAFWANGGMGGNSNNRYRDFRRMMMFRPMPWDHPNFTGGNRVMDELMSAGWSPGPDGDWGVSGVDDDALNGVDDPGEQGWPGSDDELVRDQDIVNAMSTLSSVVQLNGESMFVYDVDNDGDGIPESIWLDIGLPVKTSPDGRKYKPLVAILCKDLDGLMNINAHSHLAHDPNLNSTFAQYSGGNYQLRGTTDAYAHASNSTRQMTLPRGLGFGPAEINLGSLFRGAPNEFTTLLIGRYGPDGLPGRYNGVDDPLTITKYLGLPQDTWLWGLDGAPGVAGYDDDGDMTNDNVEETGAAGSDDIAYSYYGSPWDTRGIGAFALNHGGHPHYQYMGLPGDTIDDPYEMLLNARGTADSGSADTPYTPADLERLLRWSDIDAPALSDRLIRVAPNTFHGTSPNNWKNRRSVTTNSSHIPMPNFTWPTELRQQGMVWGQGRDGEWGVAGFDDDNDSNIDNVTEQGWPGSDDVIVDATLTKMIEARLQNGGLSNNNQRLAHIRRMFPFELLRGTPMNINRLLGDGRDDNSNQVVDEPWEWWLNADTLPAAFNNVPMNYLNGDPKAHQGPSVPSGDTLFTDPRQALARHLYCMMMFLVDQGAFPHPFDDADGGLSANDKRELTARRIAQWAVNVVDFRDPDGIMTPFEYDMNPFNGWQIDGWLGVGPGADQGWGDAGADDDNQNGVDDIGERGQGDDGTDDNHPERRLVWGLEYPEVLITESKAFHDRRVRDTNFDTNDGPNDPADEKERGFDPMGMTSYDADLDQYRVPEGSLFIELYCARSRSKNRANANQRLPMELYNHVDPSSGQFSGRLNLGYVHPTPSGDRLRHPLWRIALSEQHYTGAPARNPQALDNRPTNLYTNKRDSASYSPTFKPTSDPRFPLREQPREYTSMLRRLQNPALDSNELHIDRVIWFTDLFNPGETPGNNMDDDGNGYVDDVRGPTPGHPRGNATYYNSGGLNEGNTSTAWDVSLEPGQYLVVGPRRQTHVGSQQQPPGTFVPSPQRIVLQNLRPTSGSAPTTGIEVYNTNGNLTSGTPFSGMGAYNIQPVVGMVADTDVPDANTQRPWTNDVWPNMQPRRIGVNISEPTRDYYYQEPNPTNDPMLIPYDAYGNDVTGLPQFPDIPFDSDPPAPGEDKPLIEYGRMTGRNTYNNVRSAFLQRLADPTRPWHPVENPYLTVDWSTIDLTVFNGEDRQPGGWPMDNNGVNVHWDPDDPDPQAAPHFESRQRGNENQRIANLWSPITDFPPNASVAGGPTENYFRYSLTHTLGFLNTQHLADVRTSTSSPGAYVGDPQINAAVANTFPWLAWNNRPYANPLELMNVPAEPSSRLTAEFSENRSVIRINPATGSAYDTNDTDNYHAPYRYLLNFFHDGTAGQPGAKFYRIFDYVETPSPYVGTERWYNPTLFSGSLTGSGTRHQYYGLAPPFNYFSRFRDPGRININTIFDRQIWEAITKGYPSMDPSLNTSTMNAMFLSRQGYGSNASDVLTLDSDHPSVFGHPFRSAASADLMPLSNQQKTGVEAGLLRSRPNASPKQPLFDYTSSDPAYNTNRNPALRYLGAQRLSNLVTTHSNVFAIWTTVGFFEVQASPAGPNPAHPDGYTLGREIGEDNGEVKRHRAFYIFDRSIPVGYIPGENRDVDRAVLLRRYIE